MKKPERFDGFVEAVMTEAETNNFINVCSYFGVSEGEMEDCFVWLEELQKVEKLPVLED